MASDPTHDVPDPVPAVVAPRRRHRAQVVVATVAVAGVCVGGAALASGGGDGDGRSDASYAASAATVPTAATSSAPPPEVPTSAPVPGLDTSSAYAVLDAPGWTAPLDNVIADEKLYYAQDGSDASVSLNWRPSPPGTEQTVEVQQAELDAGYGGEVVVGTTTIDGDAAHIFGERGVFTVVGPVRQGRFLTLSGSNLTLAQIAELATHVHRQAAGPLAHDAQPGTIASLDGEHQHGPPSPAGGLKPE